MQAPMVSLQSTAKVNIIIKLCDFQASEPSDEFRFGDPRKDDLPARTALADHARSRQGDAKAKRAISLIRRRDRTLYPAF
jgi:hypothetical protein